VPAVVAYCARAAEPHPLSVALPRAEAPHGGAAWVTVPKLQRFCCTVGSSMEQSAFRMGYYGGVLWREPGLGTFITFNNERIARREPDGSWYILNDGMEGNAGRNL
jgi:hypothetical protein